MDSIGFQVPHDSITRQSKPLNQLSISVLENSQGVGVIVQKEKRMPKADQFYRNSEFLLEKYNREARFGADYDLGFHTSTLRRAPLLPPPASLDMRRVLERSESMPRPIDLIRPRPISATPSCRTVAPKKPKAKSLFIPIFIFILVDLVSVWGFSLVDLICRSRRDMFWGRGGFGFGCHGLFLGAKLDLVLASVWGICFGRSGLLVEAIEAPAAGSHLSGFFEVIQAPAGGGCNRNTEGGGDG